MNLDNPPALSKILGDFAIGFGAGLVGTATFGIVVFLSWSVVGDTLAPTDVIRNEFGVQINQAGTHPLFLHFITLAIFLGILAATVSLVTITGITDSRYKHRTTTLTHVFFSNLVILILMLPAYIMFSNLFVAEGVAAAALLHAIFAAIFSFFSLQFVHLNRHLIVSLYGVILGMVFFLCVTAMMLRGNSSFIAFLALPLLMGSLLGMDSLAQSIYGWVYKRYGVDWLNINTRFGDDYSEKKDQD